MNEIQEIKTKGETEKGIKEKGVTKEQKEKMKRRKEKGPDGLLSKLRFF